MSADIVERLRAHVHSRGGPSRDAKTGEINLPNRGWMMMLEAANEIERLRAENERLREENFGLMIRLDKAGLLKFKKLDEFRCDHE